MRARTRLKGFVNAGIQRVVPRGRIKKMPAVEYLILFANGHEVPGLLDLPEPDETWVPGGGPNNKKRWQKVRALVLTVIGEDNDPEHVNVWHEGKYLDMYVDETGVNDGLPFNAKATKIYRANWMAHEPDPGPEDALPPICGNAVLFMEKVE